MRFFMLMSAAALLAGRDALGQSQQTAHEPGDAHERAIAALRRLGGEVVVGSKQSGGGAAVVLTGSPRPAECLPHLKQIRNLHTCNL